MAELDRRRLYNTWAGIPGAVGYDEKHRPMKLVGKGELKLIVNPQRIEVHLQDGLLFDLGGQELDADQVPAEVRAWRGSHPRVPGISFAPARIYQCPISGCDLRFAWRALFEKHLDAHGLSRQALEEYLRQVDGGEQKLTVPWNEADFAGGET